MTFDLCCGTMHNMKWLKKNKYTLLSIATVLTGIGIGTVYLWHEGYIFATQATTPAGEVQNESQTYSISLTEHADPPTREELLKLVNEERAKNGVAALTEDARLDTSAQRKADDMATYHYFNHVSTHDMKLCRSVYM